MAKMDSYIMCGEKQPILENPQGNYNYAKNAMEHKAASVDGATAIVTTLFNKLNTISFDLDSINTNLKDLADNWTNFIKIDNKPMDYVHFDELDNVIKDIENNISDNGKKCIKSLNSYSDTIDEINTFLSTLESNYEDYNDLKQKIAQKRIEIYNCIDDNKRVILNNELKSLEKELNKYKKISVNDCGKWVE